MSYRCSFRDIQGSKRPNTINFLFQILLFYFEELKKQQQEAQPSEFSINGTTEKQHIPDLVEAFSQENDGF
jgi:hypothetical protein